MGMIQSSSLTSTEGSAKYVTGEVRIDRRSAKGIFM